MPKKIEIQNIPPFTLSRNVHGLLEHVNYEFDDLGFVNYRKLIPTEFLVPNRQIFIKRDAPVPKTIEGLEDNQILVLLAGWRWLAKIRGFKSIEHQVIDSRPDYSVTVKTTVCWRGNYETRGEDICFSALATASVLNTASFAKVYLAEIAENRGFSRAVRGFLNISLVGFDEINPEDKQAQIEQTGSADPTKPHGVLKIKLDERNTSFEKLKTQWIKLGHEEAQDWNQLNDIPIPDVWKILETMKKKEK